MKLFFKTATIILFAFIMFSCKKSEVGPVGPQGPQGPAGNSNTKIVSLTVLPSDWQVSPFFGYTSSCAIQVPEITQSIMNNGVVELHGNYGALDPNIQLSDYYIGSLDNIGRVVISHKTLTPSDTMKFKLVIVSGN